MYFRLHLFQPDELSNNIAETKRKLVGSVVLRLNNDHRECLTTSGLSEQEISEAFERNVLIEDDDKLQKFVSCAWKHKTKKGTIDYKAVEKSLYWMYMNEKDVERNKELASLLAEDCLELCKRFVDVNTAVKMINCIGQEC